MKNLINHWYRWELVKRMEVMYSQKAYGYGLNHPQNAGMSLVIINKEKFDEAIKKQSHFNALCMMIVRPVAGFFIIGIAIKIIITFSIWVVSI